MDKNVAQTSDTVSDTVCDKVSPIQKIARSNSGFLAFSSYSNIAIIKYTSSSSQNIVPQSSFCISLKDVVRDICFDNSGKYLIVACDDKTIQIFNVETESTQPTLSMYVVAIITAIYLIHLLQKFNCKESFKTLQLWK